MDQFSTNNLVKVVEDLTQPASFLLDKFFPEVLEDESEEIHFDIDSSKPRITPFVSPLLPGKVVTNRGFKTSTFKPAYAKDKRIWQPNAPLKRTIGEKIGGSLTPQQRVDFMIGQSLDDQLKMLTRREEVMASEALRLGQVTVSGDGFETVVVNYGRDAALTVTLVTNDRWSVVHADSDPLSDLEDWCTLIQDTSGAVPLDVVMAPDAWKNFRKRLIERGEAEMLFHFQRTGGAVADLAPNNGRKARQVAQLGELTVWSYNEVYIDDAGATQKMMPTGTVLIGGADLEGARCYGAILDEKAGYKATRYFVKSYTEEDPAVRYLLLQSAPLVVPFRVNACLAATVL